MPAHSCLDGALDSLFSLLPSQLRGNPAISGYFLRNNFLNITVSFSPAYPLKKM